MRIVEHAEQLLGQHVYLVIGGFHLAWSPMSTVEDTAKRLIGLGVKYIAPIHCSGAAIRNLLVSKYPSHYIGAHVGSVILVGDGCATVCTQH